MRNLLTAANLALGLPTLVLGLIALIGGTRQPILLVVGLFSTALAGIVLWLAYAFRNAPSGETSVNCLP
jgi:hypothetical protein